MSNHQDAHIVIDKKQSIFSKILEIIAGSFASIIGVLAGAGLLKALLSVLTMIGWLSSESGTYIVLSAAGSAVFYFLPIFLGISIAIKLGANGYVGGVIGAALLTPGITQLVEEGVTTIDFLGLPVLLADYSSTVFPIFIAMFVYAGLDKILKKVIYKDIQMFINPMISLLILVPLTMLVFGPLGTLLGEGLGSVINFLSVKSGLLAGAVLGSTWTFLTIAGLHWTVIPLAIANLATGPDPIIAMAAAAPFAQIGIGLAVLMRTRDKDLKAIAVSGIVPGALAGTTEAINYGIILRYRKTMIYVIIASAIGGAINGTLGVVMNDFVLPSVLAIPAFSPIGQFVIGVTVAFALGFLFTFVFGYENKNQKRIDHFIQVSSETIRSPLKGKVISLTEFKDPLFASERVGKGIVIVPETGDVYSPVDGVISTLFPTKHAIGITSNDGAEILIYIGVDTVKLNGEHFKAHIKQGDKVKQGDLLLQFDIERMKALGYQTTSPIVITNTEKYLDIEPTTNTTVDLKEELLRMTV
ncbi:PTS beta-glucoside transporter subunit EIIBCA [Oceanobacillus piezotolerans]|uniref:PTS beta-glucoside transporter subunit EIIBCA n=1 Tax=Oceanobacillus piezotolerans TaxID=2448030 RepID=A0A498DEV3_9BACI|nr:glucose PTS transporter subunit IIA [Oceanobacillus piezotolerans]RLL47738.1 PTS beta-glucoside transporter subunit EIIBCA [Oceanobacillus piezotolerans]